MPVSPPKRREVIEAIADRVDAARKLSEPTQAELDDWWPEPEVFGKTSAQPVYDKKKRRYRGSRANEDKAAIVRREIRRVLSEHPPIENLPDTKLAEWVRGRMNLRVPGVPVPAVRTLRRLIAKERSER
jgi:hypothetical protein